MSERDVLKKYSSVVNALLPYANEGRILEGINKFNEKIPSQTRRLIKEEVERLMSVTYEGADNSAFALFPVKTFKHFGIQMRLDEIGEDILHSETERYFNRYTVGVREAVTSSEHYKSKMRQEQKRKIIDYFKVDAQSLKDIEFGDDIAIQHNEMVECEFDGRTERFEMISVGLNHIKIQSRRVTPIKLQSDVKVHVDKKSPLAKTTSTLHCVCANASYNRDTQRHEIVLHFKESISDSTKKRIKAFVSSNSRTTALEPELESERITQAIERDMLVYNSPWIPFHIDSQANEIKILLTKQNFMGSNNASFIDNLPGKGVIARIKKELSKRDETFLFQGRIEYRGARIKIAATLNELLLSGLLETFIAHSKRIGTLSVSQFRVKPVDDFINDLDVLKHCNKDNFTSMSKMYFVRDITSETTKQLPEDKAIQLRPLPKLFIDNGQAIQPRLYMDVDVDRRTEPRYMIKKQATIQINLLRKLDAELLDISISGMKMRVQKSDIMSLPDIIKVSIPELGLGVSVYKLVSKNTQSGIIRLRVAGKKKQDVRAAVCRLIDKNDKYFAKRNKASDESMEFQILWELAARSMPSLGVVCVSSKNPKERIKTVYADGFKRDAGPFGGREGQLYMHGIFADIDAEEPRSELLDNMLDDLVKNKLVIHCIDKSKRKIVPVKEKEFFNDARGMISEARQKSKLDVLVSDVQCFKLDNTTNPVISRRLSWLHSQDPRLAKEFNKSLHFYTHVIFCTDISRIHNAILIKEFSVEKMKEVG